MINKQQGIIILNTIMMINLLALLVLSQIQLVLLQLKAMNHYLLRHQSFQTLESLGNSLVQEIISMEKPVFKPECLIHSKNPNDAIKRLKHQGGCLVANNQKYKFLVEDLGIFSCMYATIDNVIYNTEYWRLTIATMASPFMILQLGIAKVVWPVSGGEECNQINSTIIPGIISWRYL